MDTQVTQETDASAVAATGTTSAETTAETLNVDTKTDETDAKTAKVDTKTAAASKKVVEAAKTLATKALDAAAAGQKPVGKQVKVKFLRSHPAFGHFAGDEAEISQESFDKYSKDGEFFEKLK